MMIWFSSNVTIGETEDRMMMTGKHTVADIFCVSCGSIVGWRYVSKNIWYCKRNLSMFDSFGVVITFFGCALCYQETAHEKSQKYKEGKSVLERLYFQHSSGLQQLQEHDSFLYDNLENCCDRFKISGPDGSNYWVSSHGRHIGGSDADDSWSHLSILMIWHPL